jgi:hypothetical protein
VNQKVASRRVEFLADEPFQHHQVELELESSLARGEIGQASWLTLPLTLLILATLLQWDKVSPFLPPGFVDEFFQIPDLFFTKTKTLLLKA